MKLQLAKKLKLTVCGAVLTVAGIAGPAAPAGASGSGCTSAPGGIGAQNCIEIEGWGTTVHGAKSAYSSGFSYLNVCNITAQYKYRPAGAGSYRYKILSSTTCGWWKGWVWWNNPGEMTNNSSFCATQKNSVISSYANMACLSIFG